MPDHVAVELTADLADIVRRSSSREEAATLAFELGYRLGRREVYASLCCVVESVAVDRK